MCFVMAYCFRDVQEAPVNLGDVLLFPVGLKLVVASVEKWQVEFSECMDLDQITCGALGNYTPPAPSPACFSSTECG
jgi:hypothetical protein